MQTTLSNNIQADIINMISYAKDENTLIMLKEIISDFFAKKADEELNRLWDNGELNDEIIESFRSLHQRTPYK